MRLVDLIIGVVIVIALIKVDMSLGLIFYTIVVAISCYGLGYASCYYDMKTGHRK